VEALLQSGTVRQPGTATAPAQEPAAQEETLKK